MQKSQKNNCPRVSFFYKVAGLRPATYLKKKLWHSCFPVNFAKLFKDTYSEEHLRMVASKCCASYFCRKESIILRLLTGKNHPQIRLQRLRKVWIWTFDLDSWYIKSILYNKFLYWNKVFKKIKLSLAELRSLVHFLPSIQGSVSTEKRYSSSSKKGFIFQNLFQNYFNLFQS